MRVSIVVATLNRPDDLEKLFVSIAANEIRPDEIVVVEQGDIERTKATADKFPYLNTTVFFLNRKSLTAARNIGVKKSRGDIILFVDDDVVLESDYIGNAASYFKRHPEVMGITGRDAVYTSSRIGIASFMRRLVGLVFFRSTLRGPSRVLRSGHNVLHNHSDKIETVEYLPGCSMSVRRQVFEEGLWFDERLVRWCFGEDVMFSYAIHKKYPNPLRYVPSLRYEHHQSSTSRIAKPAQIRMEIIYRYIFWKEQIWRQSRLSSVCYLWAQAGYVIMMAVTSFTKQNIKAIVSSYRYLIKYREEIVGGKINFNDFILAEPLNRQEYLQNLLQTGDIAFFSYKGKTKDFSFLKNKKRGRLNFFFKPNEKSGNLFEVKIDKLYNNYFDIKYNQADVCFLDQWALRVAVVGFPVQSQLVFLKVRFSLDFFLGCLGLLRRLIRRSISLPRITALRTTRNRQLWLWVRNYVPDIKSPVGFSLSEEVGFTGLFYFCRQANVNYVVLRNYDTLPKLHRVNGDLDILVADEDRPKLVDFLKKNPGRLPVDVWSVSGPHYKQMPYYPPPLARQILKGKIAGPAGSLIPADREALLSFAYHILYHKGEKAGVPSTIDTVEVNTNPENDYSGAVKSLAVKNSLDIGQTMEELDIFLASQGWRPKIDTLVKLSEDNQWIKDRFLNCSGSQNDQPHLGFMVCREKARGSQILPDIVSVIKGSGFAIVFEKELDAEEKKIATEQLRGGFWSAGDKEDPMLLPAHVFVITDLISPKNNKEIFDTRLRALKESIREHFDGKGDAISIVHATDNTLESLEYAETLFPEILESIKEEARRRQDESGEKVAVFNELGKPTRFKKSINSIWSRFKHGLIRRLFK